MIKDKDHAMHYILCFILVSISSLTLSSHDSINSSENTTLNINHRHIVVSKAQDKYNNAHQAYNQHNTAYTRGALTQAEAYLKLAKLHVEFQQLSQELEKLEKAIDEMHLTYQTLCENCSSNSPTIALTRKDMPENGIQPSLEEHKQTYLSKQKDLAAVMKKFIQCKSNQEQAKGILRSFVRRPIGT